VRQANIERVENGYIVHIFTTGKDSVENKHFIATSEYEVGEIIKKHLNDKKKEDKK
jgi:hypothetical protein